MKLYLITYQTKRPATVAISEGEWKDHEKRVVGTDNATSVINAVIKSVKSCPIVHDLRIKEIKDISKVDLIAPSILEKIKDAGNLKIPLGNPP